MEINGAKARGGSKNNINEQNSKRNTDYFIIKILV